MSRTSSKAAADNRANQMNPNNSAYWAARGEPAPSAPAPAEPSAPAENPRKEK